MKDKKYYGHDYYESMNKLVNKTWLIVGLLLVSALITFAIYFFNNTLNKNMNNKFNETSEKIDSVNQSQTEVLNTLNSINEKLEYNNQMVIDTIMKVNNSVNKFGKSVKEIRSEIDTLIVYIKK